MMSHEAFRVSVLALGLLPVAAAPALSNLTAAPAPGQTTAVKVESLAKGLTNPWALQFMPDGRMLVTEKPGRLRIVSADGKLSEPIPGIPGVDPRGQGGLLDVRLAPDFEKTNIIYLAFSEPREGGKNSTSVARGRLAMSEKGTRIEGLAVIFRQDPAWQSTAHFGSRLVFAKDNTLFVTTGDRFAAKDEAQNPGNHIGKVIHINPDGSIPQGNLKKEGWAPEVRSIGHRNIQGAAIHPDTGKLWLVEHGAQGGDELNISEAGKNYGWPVISYGIDYSGAKIGEGTAKDGLEQPLYYWDPSIAVSGLAFYTGDLFPQWKGNLFVGGLKGAHLSRLVLDGEKIVGEEKLLAERDDRIRDVRQGPDGALYVLTDHKNGEILKITPAK